MAYVDPEVLVEQCPEHALHKAVRLRPPHSRSTVLDLFQLQEQLAGMLFRPVTVLPAVVAEYGATPGLVVFEGRQHLVV